jgi:hypothetical protein
VEAAAKRAGARRPAPPGSGHWSDSNGCFPARSQRRFAVESLSSVGGHEAL